MPPIVATVICFVGILVLFRLDRDVKVRSSIALWLPVMWLLLASSRPLLSWGSDTTEVAGSLDRIAEGHPLERNIYTGLLLLGIIVLIRRRRHVAALLRTNLSLVTFLSYCALSIAWSDYPDVAFKRWIKSVGDIVVLAVVVTDPSRTAALKRLLARLAFLLVPISILLIKYYPNWGRAYNGESGAFSPVGVTSDKNMLGVICLVCGLGAVWRILQVLKDPQRPSKRPLIAHVTVLLMVAWLFWQVNSATSLSCFVMGSILMMITTIPSLGRRRGLLVLVMVVFVGVSISALFLGIGTGMVESMGRNATLTGRTDLWQQLAGMNPNSLLGAGFESFWLGPRLNHLWSIFHWKPNEAHNGYLEVYLNLGAIGVALLGLVILSGCLSAMKLFRWDQEAGRIRLGFLLVGIIYSLTEAGFRVLSPVWISFLFAVTDVPEMLSKKKIASNEVVTHSIDDTVTLPTSEPVILSRS